MRRFHSGCNALFGSKSSRQRPGFAPSLRYFMLRHEALTLYRDVLRVALQVSKRPDGKQLADDIRQQARAEFAAHEDVVDEQVMRSLIVDGRQKFDYMMQMVMLTSTELDESGLESGPRIREYEQVDTRRP